MNNDDIFVIKKGDIEVVLTEKRIKELSSKFIEACADTASNYDDFGMNAKVVDLLIKLKQAWYPATQKNLNLNVEKFDDKLKAWMDARREISIAQEEEKGKKKNQAIHINAT